MLEQLRKPLVVCKVHVKLPSLFFVIISFFCSKYNFTKGILVAVCFGLTKGQENKVEF